MLDPASRQPRRSLVIGICRRLRREHGPVELADRLPPLDELMGTILSQNTSNANSDAAFAELRRRFRTWDDVRRASVKRIAAAIRRGGLARQKAPRIKAILQRVLDERGELSLDFLRAAPIPEGLAFLRSLPGVGPKTAACVLLFACDKPVLPVNTQVHRVARRLGLIGPRVGPERAHELLAALVPARLVLECHVLLIRHGRRVCLPRRPRCDDCVLLDLCPFGRVHVSGPSWMSSGDLERTISVRRRRDADGNRAGRHFK